MKKLVKHALVQYPGNKLDKQRIDLLVVNGKIEQIKDEIDETIADVVISGKDLVLFPSLVDMQCAIGEPGEEEKEDFQSASNAALAGGFGEIVMLPNTQPVLDSKTTLSGVKNETKHLPVGIHAYGALSKGCLGTELSEMFDLSSSGAIGFTDGKSPVTDSNMMKRALEYSNGLNTIICSFPLDARINPGGIVNESLDNLILGLKPSPNLAEELMVVRDLYLAEYTKARLHFSTISTEKSVELIRDAKKKGINVTCGVAIANLIFTEKQLAGFDSNYKTNPPLRSEKDRNALLTGVMDGIIDVVVTDHTPEIIENKDREFDFASYGMTMLETALSLVNEYLTELQWDKLVETMSITPRKILTLQLPKLEQGEEFNFTLFDSADSWVYQDDVRQSKASNSPLLNKKLLGRVILA